ncbi:STAS domain-containing protein [Streptomyces sp. NPDC058291]|uniref:STAS domain-containing protein n=1 Tax=Streptomyces sp. NPDC058291 TaxID=3346427 RepID=UPI0036E8BC4F
MRTDAGRVVVAVRGELDLESTGRLEQALHGALGAAVGGVDLELDGVAFCDCSTLNVLLAARERGLREGRTVTVRTVSPAVERLLDLTGTRTLFEAPVPAADTPGRVGGSGAADREPRGADGLLVHPHDAGVVHNLRVEVVRLRRALQTRPVIDLVRGILMASSWRPSAWVSRRPGGC